MPSLRLLCLPAGLAHLGTGGHVPIMSNLLGGTGLSSGGNPVPGASRPCVSGLGEGMWPWDARRPGAHQRGLTQQAAAPAQAPQCHVEIGAAAAPAGNLVERIGGEQLLGAERAGGHEPAKARGPRPGSSSGRGQEGR